MESLTVDTSKLRVHCYAAGPPDGIPLFLVHGNLASSRFYDETLEAAAAHGVRAVAMDLRGFGDTEPLPVDATRGMGDFADDLRALVEALGVTRPVHLTGWSTGGGVILRYAIDHPGEVASLTLESPVSPMGFGGTKDVEGTPCWPDWAGCGAGSENPEYRRRLLAGDRGDESPVSPRNVMNAFYWMPTFRVAPEREDAFVDEILKTVVGDDNEPGDSRHSPNWPGVAPGDRGVLNALCGKHLDHTGIVDLDPKPPIQWIRGDGDLVVSDTSMFDFGQLGALGVVPEWPGLEVFPPQPMVGQTRAVLEAYRAKGGAFTEEVFADCGHSPHIEHPGSFNELLYGLITGLG